MWLTFPSRHEHGRTIFVDGETIVLGRDDACEVIVDDPNVSRRHVSLEPLAEGRVALCDLGPSNGTFPTGKRGADPWPRPPDPLAESSRTGFGLPRHCSRGPILAQTIGNLPV